MTEPQGWIPLWRKSINNEFYREKRVFSRWEAWIDILLELQHDETPQKVVIGNRVLWCNCGESLKSLDTWADRWGWTKSKTRRVLALFCKCSMIRLKSETVTTRISIVNIELFKVGRNTDETQMKRKRNASETQTTPDNNVKKVKKVKKNITISDFALKLATEYEPIIHEHRPKVDFVIKTQAEYVQEVLNSGYSEDELTTVVAFLRDHVSYNQKTGKEFRWSIQVQSMNKFLKPPSEYYKSYKNNMDVLLDEQKIWHQSQSQSPQPKRHTQPCPKGIKPI